MEFDLLTILYTLPVMLISSAIHEYAHAYTAYLLGDDTAKAEGRMTINPISHIDPLGLAFMIFGRIGWSKPVPVNPYNFENPKVGNALVSIAGPISNMLLVAISAGLFKLVTFMEPSTITYVLLSFLLVMIYINVSLALFNLLPIPPLDGSNIVESFLPKQWQEGWSSLSQYAPFLLLLLVLPFSPLFTIFSNFWYNLLSSVIGALGSIMGIAL